MTWQTELILTLCWLIRELAGALIPLLIRKKQGYEGFLYSIPPGASEDVDTLRDRPTPKEGWKSGRYRS